MMGLVRDESDNNGEERTRTMSDYSRVYLPEYKETRSKGMKLEHVIIAEHVLGKPLPKGAVVHHADGDKANNKRSNLVICPSGEYHQLLHMRIRAKAERGNPNYRKCCVCKKYDEPKNLYFNKSNRSFKHSECWKGYCKGRREKIREGKWTPR